VSTIALGGEGCDAPCIEEAAVLSKSRCPYTGVVNYFTDRDPLLAVGSVAATGAPERYVWRCYVGEESSGLAPDLSLAEAKLCRAVAAAVDQRARGDRSGESERASRASTYWRKLNDAPCFRP
jgi:hypothetical protein